MLECAAIRLPSAVCDGDKVPCFPLMLLAVESEGAYILPVSPALISEDAEGKLLGNLGSAMVRENVFPRALIPRDERTAALLQDFCNKTEIDLYDVQETPALDEAEHHLMSHLTGARPYDDADDDDMDDMAEDAEDTFDSMIRALSRLSVEEIKKIPRFVAESILDMASEGLIPPNVAEKLRKAFPQMGKRGNKFLR